MKQRIADPYRDLDVIDARAPRFNQAVIGSLSLVAVLTGWWPILALLALQLAVGLRFGRRYCLPCLAYFELVQPRFGEGPLEDARAPRFANMVGVAVLGSATATCSGSTATSSAPRRATWSCSSRTRSAPSASPSSGACGRRAGRS